VFAIGVKVDFLVDGLIGSIEMLRIVGLVLIGALQFIRVVIVALTSEL